LKAQLFAFLNMIFVFVILKSVKSL